jgi:adenine phosphoribosyltransferase
MPDRFYNLEVAGCSRKLSVMNISDHMAIASFVILGDMELVSSAAEELVKKLPPADLIMTAEAKGIPLAQEIARLLHMKYFVVARKSVKGYMQHPLIVEDHSITTNGKQILCLMDQDIERVRNHRVILVDDVISTGRIYGGAVQTGGKGRSSGGRPGLLCWRKGMPLAERILLFLEIFPCFRKNDASDQR